MAFKRVTVVLAVLMTASMASATSASASLSGFGTAQESASTKACFRAAGSPPDTIAMPKPHRLLRTIDLRWNGTITLAPPPAVAPVINPALIWKSHPTAPAGSRSQLFLAFYSASVPAELQPDGTLRPFSNHVLSWILLTQHAPFDTAGISIPNEPSGTSPPSRAP